MKRRLFSLSLCVCILLTFNSCSKNTEETETRGVEYFTMPVPIETDAPKESKVEKETEDEKKDDKEDDRISGTGKGKIIGDSYINEAFAFEFSLPDGYDFLPLDEMSSMILVNGDYQMLASDVYGNNVGILHMYMYRDDDITDVGQELYNLLEQKYNESEINFEIKNKGLVQFVNNKANLITVDIYGGDVNVFQEFFVIGRDNKYIIFMFTGMDKENINIMKKAFEPFGKIVDNTNVYRL